MVLLINSVDLLLLAPLLMLLSLLLLLLLLLLLQESEVRSTQSELGFRRLMVALRGRWLATRTSHLKQRQHHHEHQQEQQQVLQRKLGGKENSSSSNSSRENALKVEPVSAAAATAANLGRPG